MAKPLLPHRHSGRLAPHHHTSYTGLFLVLFLAAAVLLAASFNASAADGDAAYDSQQGNVGVSAAIPAKEPTVAPTITRPGSGQEFTALPVEVGGSCESGYIVKVFANDAVVGAGLCSSSGTYTIPVSIFTGNNTLMARAYNVFDRGGIASAAVGARFAPPGQPSPPAFQKFNDSTPQTNQLFIKGDVFYRGGTPGSKLSWPIELVGGTPPYAVSVGWGDGASDVYSRTAGGRLEIAHTYKGEGKVYPVVIKASDANGNTAYLQLVSLPSAETTPPAAGPSAKGLAIVWPILGALVLVVIAFLAGEWTEKRILKHQGEAAV